MIVPAPIMGDLRQSEPIALIELSALPVLLVGARGTGKGLFARHIHSRSQRKGRLILYYRRKQYG